MEGRCECGARERAEKRAGSSVSERSLFQATEGGSNPTPALHARDLHFESCGKALAVDGVRRWHSRLPNCQDGPWMYAFWGRVKDHVYVVGLWSSPSTRCLPQHFIELRRMACAPDAPRYTASRFLAWMVRQLPSSHEKAISYQDTDVHTGTIYKACGWIPAHTVKPKRRVRDRSKPRHGTNRPYRQDINGTDVAASPKIRWEISL